MELVPNESAQEKPVVFDISQLDERLLGHDLYLNFLSRRTSFGEGKRIYDLTAACDDGIDEEGNLNMQLLATIESTLEYAKGHEGEPIAFIQTVSIDSIKKIDATIGVLALDDVAAGRFGYTSGTSGLAGQGTPYSLNAYNGSGRKTITVERSIPLDRSEDIIPFYTHDIKIGQPYSIRDTEVTTVHEVVVGTEIISWIKENFGETEEGYKMYIGFLQALRANGAESFLNDEFFVKMLAREHQVEKMTRTIIERYIATERDITTTFEAILVDNRTETEQQLARVAEFSGDLLPIIKSVRNGEGGVLDPLTSESWYPLSPETRLRLIDWRLKHVDPGTLELPVLE